jgi:hypothetical protein
MVSFHVMAGAEPVGVFRARVDKMAIAGAKLRALIAGAAEMRTKGWRSFPRKTAIRLSYADIVGLPGGQFITARVA